MRSLLLMLIAMISCSVLAGCEKQATSQDQYMSVPSTAPIDTQHNAQTTAAAMISPVH